MGSEVGLKSLTQVFPNDALFGYNLDILSIAHGLFEKGTVLLDPGLHHYVLSWLNSIVEGSAPNSNSWVHIEKIAALMSIERWSEVLDDIVYTLSAKLRLRCGSHGSWFGFMKQE